MDTLDAIAIACQTDRATQFTRTYGKPHGYAPHYDRVFSPIRLDKLKVIEIGVGGGEGVKMWLEYFSNGSHIYGVDNVRDTNEWQIPGKKEGVTYTFVYGDQSSDTFWECFKVDYGTDFDIIIDDGSHISKDIIVTFNKLWPTLKSGGFYCVEDLNVAYGGGMFTPAGFPNHLDWIKAKLDEINQNGEISFMQFSKELMIIRKAGSGTF